MKRVLIGMVAVLTVFLLTAVHDLGPRIPRISLSRSAIAQESTAKPRDADSPRRQQSPTASEFIDAKLALPEDFEYPDVPLQDVLDSFSLKLAVPIVVDKKALEEAGIGSDKTVNMQMRGIGADKFLTLVLGELELTWLTRDGYVVVTTIEKASTLLEVRVYNCSDLIELVKPNPALEKQRSSGGFGGTGPATTGLGGEASGASGSATPSATPPGNTRGGFFAVPPGGAKPHDDLFGDAPQSPELVPDNDSLIRLIQETMEPDSWTASGGIGSIEIYHGGLVVVNQTGPTHRRIALLLDMLRKAKKAEPGTVIRER